jgi:nuclear RNA export factor
LSINGYEFAGANIKVVLADAPAGGRSSFSFNKSNSNNSGPDLGDASQVRNVFKSILARRYNMDAKLLDLSALESDADFNKLGLSEITSKTFIVLMRICDDVFTSNKAKEDGVLAVSLANNKLKDVALVTTLAQTFPALKNLDLSNNGISEMRDLQRWRHKFRQLEHIILTNNPIEQDVPDFKVHLINWYPKLHSIDLVQIPTTELESIRAKKGPPKVQPGRFDDQGGIGENFLKTFFAGYDNDRNGLLQYYYDESSTFHMQVNTQSLRDPSHPKPQGNEWTHYIKHSRNLLKLDHIGARAKRSHRGPSAIANLFAELPATRHPDFAASPEKWLLECRQQPGLPDPTGTSPGGVNGLVIITHGEFEEPEHNKLRSFDRTFILGPGGPHGVRVISDSVTIRAYGGSEAFQPEPQEAVPMNEAQEKEMMAVEVSKATGMNMQYAVMCLEQVGWSYQEALAAFAKAKDSIPAEAYVR